MTAIAVIRVADHPIRGGPGGPGRGGPPGPVPVGVTHPAAGHRVAQDGSMPSELSGRLAALVRWIDPGPGATHLVSDVSGWWRDPEVLARLGPALVAPFRAARPTVVVSPGGHRIAARSARRDGARGRLRAGPQAGRRSAARRGARPGRRARRTSGADGSTWPCGTATCPGVTGCWWWTTGWLPGRRSARSTRSAPRGARRTGRHRHGRARLPAGGRHRAARTRGSMDGADLTA